MTATTNAIVKTPRHPSPVLIVMSVLSFFLVTLAFASALSQAGSVRLFLIPSTIGFVTTIPYHIILYIDARKRTQGINDASVSGLSLLMTPSPIHTFILAALWAVIFFTDILFCLGERPYVPTGMIISNIIACFVWVVLLFIALKDTQEGWDAEKTDTHTVLNQDDGLPVYEGRNGEIHYLNQNSVPGCISRYVYLASFVIATIALVFSISVSFSCLVNVIAILLTGPYHISIFVLSGHPRQSSTPLLPHAMNATYMLLLVSVWCCAVVTDAISYGFPFQAVLSAIFGGIECIIVGYIAVRCIQESLAPRENQIQLPPDA